MAPNAAAIPPPPGHSRALPSRSDIDAAARRLAPWVRQTPLVEVDPADLELPGRRPLVLKLEMLQHAGSFKGRGAHNQLLGKLPAAGVVAASGGNYGVAVAYAAHRLGVAATVFVPDSTAPAKLERLRSLGAAVEVIPGYYDEALAASHAHAAATGARFLHAFDQPEMIEGAGTLAAELERQADGPPSGVNSGGGLDRVIVAVGGAGLIGGVACWYRGAVNITGVETRGCRALDAALRADRVVDTDVSGLAADALGARRVGELDRRRGGRRGRRPRRRAAAPVAGAPPRDRARRGRRPGGAHDRCAPGRSRRAHRRGAVWGQRRSGDARLTWRAAGAAPLVGQLQSPPACDGSTPC